MKSFRVTLALLFALALVAITTTALLAAAPQEQVRGGLAEQQAERTIAKPALSTHLARVAHSEDWDAHYFDGNVNSSIKSQVTDYVSPLTWQGCHAQKDHKIQARLAASNPF